MLRRGEQRGSVGDLDETAEIHDGDAVRHMVHDREVVADEQVGQAEIVLQVAHQVEDLGLDRHVERRGRLVAQDQVRLAGERPGDGDALALAAGEFVRVFFAVGGGEADLFEQAVDPAVRFPCVAGDAEGPDRLGDDVPHPPARVERGLRVLEDHGEAPADRAGSVPRRGHVMAVDRHPAPGRPVEAGDQPRDRGLAAAGFADHRQGHALADGEAHAVDRFQDFRFPSHRPFGDRQRQAEMDRQILDLQERRISHRRPLLWPPRRYRTSAANIASRRRSSSCRPS